MTVSTTLDSQQRSIQELIAQLRASPRLRQVKMPGLVEAVMLTIAIEEIVLGEPQTCVRADAGRHRAAHTRARLALFRAVTSATDSDLFERSLAALHEVFDARLRDLAGSIASPEDPELARRIDEQIESVCLALGASPGARYLSRREPVSEVIRVA